MTFSVRDLYVNYLPQLAAARVPAEKTVVPQHTRAEHRGSADAAALSTYCIARLSESSRPCIPMANNLLPCIWWSSNVGLNTAHTYGLSSTVFVIYIVASWVWSLPTRHKTPKHFNSISISSADVRASLSHRNMPVGIIAIKTAPTVSKNRAVQTEFSQR